MKHTAIVTKHVQETPDIAVIYFTRRDGSVFDHVAGQYITVFFDDTHTPEGKAYSLSSAPHEREMSITVKKVGEFSGRLHGLRKGDTLQISEPYGFFNPEDYTRPLTMIAAGVGIAPIWSIMKHAAHMYPRLPIELYYGNKTVNDTAHRAALDEHVSRATEQRVHHYITRQPDVPPQMIARRMTSSDYYRGNETHYMICGSVEFVRDVRHQLVEAGAVPEQISTEIFFE